MAPFRVTGCPCPPCQAVGLDFFSSMVAACRAGQLSQRDTRRFVTGFLEAKAASSRPKRGTGQCGYRGLGTLRVLLLWAPHPGMGAPRHSLTCCWTS